VLELRLKHIIKGRREGARKRGRRRKQLLDYVKETKMYCVLKEEALDITLWRTGFGRGCGPALRLDYDDDDDDDDDRGSTYTI